MGLDRITDDLVLAFDLVQADPPTREDAHAVLGRELELTRGRPEHHRPDLSVIVDEREVEVTGAPSPEVRDFAFDRDRCEGRLDDRLEA